MKLGELIKLIIYNKVVRQFICKHDYKSRVVFMHFAMRLVLLDCLFQLRTSNQPFSISCHVIPHLSKVFPDEIQGDTVEGRDYRGLQAIERVVTVCSCEFFTVSPNPLDWIELTVKFRYKKPL